MSELLPIARMLPPASSVTSAVEARVAIVAFPLTVISAWLSPASSDALLVIVKLPAEPAPVVVISKPSPEMLPVKVTAAPAARVTAPAPDRVPIEIAVVVSTASSPPAVRDPIEFTATTIGADAPEPTDALTVPFKVFAETFAAPDGLLSSDPPVLFSTTSSPVTEATVTLPAAWRVTSPTPALIVEPEPIVTPPPVLSIVMPTPLSAPVVEMVPVPSTSIRPVAVTRPMVVEPVTSRRAAPPASTAVMVPAETRRALPEAPTDVSASRVSVVAVIAKPEPTLLIAPLRAVTSTVPPVTACRLAAPVASMLTVPLPAFSVDDAVIVTLPAFVVISAEPTVLVPLNVTPAVLSTVTDPSTASAAMVVAPVIESVMPPVTSAETMLGVATFSGAALVPTSPPASMAREVLAEMSEELDCLAITPAEVNDTVPPVTSASVMSPAAESVTEPEPAATLEPASISSDPPAASISALPTVTVEVRVTASSASTTRLPPLVATVPTDTAPVRSSVTLPWDVMLLIVAASTTRACAMDPTVPPASIARIAAEMVEPNSVETSPPVVIVIVPPVRSDSVASSAAWTVSVAAPTSIDVPLPMVMSPTVLVSELL